MLMIVLKINDSLIGFSVDEQGLIHQRIYMNTQERGGMTFLDFTTLYYTF